MDDFAARMDAKPREDGVRRREIKTRIQRDGFNERYLIQSNVVLYLRLLLPELTLKASPYIKVV